MPCAAAPGAGCRHGCRLCCGRLRRRPPPREFTRAWGNAATNGTITTGRFISRPLTARLPRLQLELCCVPNAENIRIELVEPATGRHFRCGPSRLANGSWSPCPPRKIRSVWKSPRTTRRPRWPSGRCRNPAACRPPPGGCWPMPCPCCWRDWPFAGLLARDLWCRTGGVSAPVRGLALGTVLAVLVLIWPARHFDSRQLASQYYAHWAQSFAQTRQLDAARRFLREALWLCPRRTRISKPASGPCRRNADQYQVPDHRKVEHLSRLPVKGTMNLRVLHVRFRQWWRREIRPLLILALVLCSLRSSLADWNDVPSGSMQPTILVGDRIFVNKLAYDLKVPFTTWHLAEWANPKLGVSVVFYSPRESARLVKRVVGLPGDTVELRAEPVDHRQRRPG